VLILVSVWFAFKAAGKIFRVGVLMTGNPPKLKEILGWLRPGGEPSVAAEDPPLSVPRGPN
jgi:hypothetical protein